MHDFSVWLGTGSKPADITRFRSQISKEIYSIMNNIIFIDHRLSNDNQICIN